MIVQHNLLANFTQRELKISTGQKAKSTEKMASGYRINRSADDAAGLTISEKMRWNIRGLDKASNNCQDGASMMQVADGALTEVHAMLDRMKELSVQAANDTNTPEDRQAIQQEMNQLVQEIDRIGDTTEFNTMKLFHGSDIDVIDQNTGRRISASDIPISDFEIADITLIGEPLGPVREYTEYSDLKRNNTELNLGVVLKGNYNVSGTKYPLIYTGSYGGDTSSASFYFSFEDSDHKIQTEKVKFEDMFPGGVTKNGDTYTRTFRYKSKIDNDVKFEIKQNVKIGQNDGIKQGYTISYDIDNQGTKDCTTSILMSIDTSYGGTHQGDFDESYFSNGTEIKQFELHSDLVGASNAVYYLGSENAKTIGNAYLENGFNDSLRSFSIFNLKNPELPFSEYVEVNNAHILAFGQWATNENTQYAESRIRDTDMAKEMVNYSKHNIIEQAGQNMLAQANQSPQGVMSLLG